MTIIETEGRIYELIHKAIIGLDNELVNDDLLVIGPLETTITIEWSIIQQFYTENNLEMCQKIAIILSRCVNIVWL